MEIKLRSSIKPSLMKRTLFIGSLFAGLGVFLLVICALFVPAQTLGEWGLGIFLLAFLLIGAGLIPYRRLTRLEITPNEIVLDEKNVCIIFNKQPTLLIPFLVIEKISYLESEIDYGIKIDLKNNSLEEVTVLNRRFNMAKFHHQAKTNYQCDLFLRYFNKRAFDELNSFK